MHREQVEAVVQEVIEKTFGNMQTLHELHLILKKTNVQTMRQGESDALPLNAGLFQSLFLSHVRLAQMFSDVVQAHSGLLERVDTLENATVAIQEAVINLQNRVAELERKEAT